MTGEEMERAIGLLLESQAALTSKVDANTEAIARLTATAERHELELVEVRSDMRDLQSQVRDVQSQVHTMQTEVRDAVDKILGVAESLAENAKVLTVIQQDTRARLDRLEGER